MTGENIFSEAKFIDPQAIIDQLDFFEGSRVADFGCGTGYFSFPISRKVGKSGLVYALDVLPQKIEVVESLIKTQEITNIIPKHVNVEKIGGSKIEADTMDWVVIKDMLFQNTNKEIILEEAKRVLKPGGRVLLVEWKTGDTQIGPEQSLRLLKEDAMILARTAGFKIPENEPVDAGNFHYGLILSKTNA
jgi:ubiquinone/menaquinone biosynthesis C-methylase UbiE